MKGEIAAAGAKWYLQGQCRRQFPGVRRASAIELDVVLEGPCREQLDTEIWHEEIFQARRGSHGAADVDIQRAAASWPLSDLGSTACTPSFTIQGPSPDSLAWPGVIMAINIVTQKQRAKLISAPHSCAESRKL